MERVGAMANNCVFLMRISGDQASVDEFIKVVENDYHYNEDGRYQGTFDRHLSRIFSNEVIGYENDKFGICTAELVGDCAWSVYSCMTEGGYYSRRFLKEYRERSHATTLKLETGRLGLRIEVHSEEPGIGFKEHFLYDKGEEIINECLDIEC